MAKVIVDEVMLREPNLLIPGKKPIGPVKIDWPHSLVPDLLCCVPTPVNPQEMLSGTMPTFTGQAHISHRGIETPDAGYDDKCLYDFNFDTTYDQWTIMTGFVNTAANLGWSTCLWDMPGATLVERFISGNSPDAGDLWHQSSSSFGSGSTASYWNDGLPHVAVHRATPNGAYTRLDSWMDNENEFDQYAALATADLSRTGLYIRSAATANSSPVGYTSFFYVWGRSLSNIEINLLRYDPYQFLIPK